MKKNYTLKVKPRRFIYHVAHSNTRQSILKKGLVGCPQEINGFRNAIFAHNSVMPNYSWYPFCFDAILIGLWTALYLNTFVMDLPTRWKKTITFFGGLILGNLQKIGF